MISYLTAFSVLAAILLLVGIALVIAEMLIPGFGIAGISGFIAIIAGVIVQAKSIAEGLLIFAAVLIILGIALAIVARSFKKGAFAKSPFVLNVSIDEKANTSKQEYLVGKRGITLTPLRPSGMVEIQGERISARAENTYAEADVMVVVIAANANEIIVRKI